VLVGGIATERRVSARYFWAASRTFQTRLGTHPERVPLAGPLPPTRHRVGVVVDGGVTFLHASGSGDDTLLAVTADAKTQVTLVSADRVLCQRPEDLGSDVATPGWLIRLLDE
jgi:hypothetical protein